MNLDAIWQTHRRFLIAVAVGLMVFLLGKAVIGVTLRQPGRAAEVRILNFRRSLRTATYDAGAVNTLKRHLSELADRVAALERRTLPPWRDAFRPEPGESPKTFYIEVTGRLRQELVARALRAGVEVDQSLGLPPISPDDAQQLERLLRGLDVVERVVGIAVVARARLVDEINIETRARARRHRPGTPEPAIDITPVTMEVVLREERVWDFLLDVAFADPALGLDRLEILPLNPRRKERAIRLRFGVGEVPRENEGGTS